MSTSGRRLRPHLAAAGSAQLAEAGGAVWADAGLNATPVGLLLRMQQAR